MRWQRFRLEPSLLLLLVLSLWALTPLLSPGYFYSAHDGRHSVFYVTMFHEAIADGAWWPRWAMHHNQGYGYPTFIIQAPFAFYVAEFFIQLGAGITNAVKLTWAVGFLASAWGMYALVKYWLATLCPPQGQNHSLAALVAGLLYVYAPYHLLDAYVRAALAETMLFAWLPWVFLAFDRLIVGGKEAGWQQRLLVAALCFAGLLLTHVFALMAVTPLLAAFILFRLWSVAHAGRGLIAQTILAAIGGISALLLSAIFILPLLVEGPLLEQEVYTSGTYSYARHWVYWGQFFSSLWGYGYSDDPLGANDGMGFQLGLMLVLLALSALPLLMSKRLPQGLAPLLGFLLLAAFAVLFVMTPAASTLWRAIPILAVIQFPWRLLFLSAFLLSALGGLVIGSLMPLTPQAEQERGAPASAIVIALLVIFASNDYLQAQALQPIEPWREDGRAVFAFESEHPDMLGYTQQVTEKFTQSPLTEQYAAEIAAADFSNDKLQRLGIIKGKGTVIGNYSGGRRFGGEVEMTTAGTVQVRLYDFPGWQVRLDGETVSHRVSLPYGLIEVDLPSGRHQLDLSMGTTPVRSAGVVISGVTLLLLFGLNFRNYAAKHRLKASKIFDALISASLLAMV